MKLIMVDVLLVPQSLLIFQTICFILLMIKLVLHSVLFKVRDSMVCVQLV